MHTLKKLVVIFRSGCKEFLRFEGFPTLYDELSLWGCFAHAGTPRGTPALAWGAGAQIPRVNSPKPGPIRAVQGRVRLRPVRRKSKSGCPGFDVNVSSLSFRRLSRGAWLTMGVIKTAHGALILLWGTNVITSEPEQL